MGNPFQQGTHSCSSPGSESCQNLGEYILVFLGFIISINIGINVVTLLRCRLEGFLNQIFHNFFQEDNMLELAPIIPKKLLIHSPPALKQTKRPPVYQDPPICRNPPVCQNPPVCGSHSLCQNSAVCGKPPVCGNHSLCQNSAVCQNLAVHRSPAVCGSPAVCDLCAMDSVTLDLAPQAPAVNTRFSRQNLTNVWMPGFPMDMTRFPSIGTLAVALAIVNMTGTLQCLRHTGKIYQLVSHPLGSISKKYLGRSAKGVEAKSKMGLEACVYPIKPSSHNAESQSCKESAEPDMYGYSPQFFHRVTISPLNCHPMPSTNHVMYNSWKKKRQVWEESRGVDSLPQACPPDTLEKPSQDWVYYSLEEW